MKLFVPPRRLFVDGAHHAAFLAYLDGVDRLRAGAVCPEPEGKRQFAAHALVSLGNAKYYLSQSDCWDLDFSVHPPPRAEYGLAVMMSNIGVAEVRASEVLRLVPSPPVGRDLPFALVLREAACPT